MDIDSQPQLEPKFLNDEVAKASTMAHSLALVEIGEAVTLLVWWVGLDEECLAERPVRIPMGEADPTIAASRLSWARR